MHYRKLSCALITLAFVLAIVGTIQPLFSLNRPSPIHPNSIPSVQTMVSLWQSCDKDLTIGVTCMNCTTLKLDGADANVALGVPCPALAHRFHVSRAFAVASDITLGVIVLPAFARMALAFDHEHKIHTAIFAAEIAGTVLTLIAFPLLISIYSTSFHCSSGATAFIFSGKSVGGVGMGGISMSLAFASIACALIIEAYDRFSRDARFGSGSSDRLLLEKRESAHVV